MLFYQSPDGILSSDIGNHNRPWLWSYGTVYDQHVAFEDAFDTIIFCSDRNPDTLQPGGIRHYQGLNAAKHRPWQGLLSLVSSYSGLLA
jgi:hypothetical protein